MSPLTLYSPGLPILQPGGGAEAREVGKGPLMSTSSRASRGFVVSIVIFLLPPPMMASPAFLLEHYVFESGALVLCVVARGHGKAPVPRGDGSCCCCDTQLDRLV